MMEVSEFQKKRAENIIWSSARDYSFTPDFKIFDRSGRASIYWNVILGAAHRHYDYAQFEELFKTFAMYEDGYVYEDIFWTALEPLVYERELPGRPVLSRLREGAHTGESILPPEMRGPFDKGNYLEFSPSMSTEEIVEKAWDFFERWYRVRRGKAPRKTPRLPAMRKKNIGTMRDFQGGILWHPKNFYTDTAVYRSAEEELATKMSAEELRAFMETKFGRPMFSPIKSAELEKELCSGKHGNTHLLFTYGERPPAQAIRSGFEALSRQRESAQVESNRKYYAGHINANRTAIADLSASIMNSVLLYLQSCPVKSNSGTLDGTRVWRAARLDDEKVFTREERSTSGDVCVDILLDASTSQQHRLETISSQAYIIAKALDRCMIPCRVSGFCSMTGFTIFRIFRDYLKPQDSGRIFEYVANGCNRDGLAVRAARKMISDVPYEHRILIILSDVKPNDVVKIHGREGESEAYFSIAGLKDTATEVRLARADGISTMCIFTGDDEDLPGAKMVYGRDFTRIKDFSMFARAVGMLIRNQIKNF